MKLRPVLAFVPLILLCSLLSTRWMFVDRWPEAASTVPSETCAAVLAFTLCTFLALGMRESFTMAAPHWLAAMGAGALLFAGLDAGQISGGIAPRNTDLIIALALTPVVLAVAGIALARNGAGLSGMALAPGILAPTGLLLLAPEPRLTSLVADVVLVGAPIAVGLGAAWLLSGQPVLRFDRAAAAFAGVACLFALLLTRVPHQRVSGAAVALDALTMLLAVATLASLDARGFAAQFAIVPLVSFCEYLIFAEVRPTWQQTVGIILLGAAAALLLAPQKDVEQVGSMSLFGRER